MDVTLHDSIKTMHMENPFQELNQRLNNIEQMLIQLTSQPVPSQQNEGDDLLNIEQAALLIHLAKNTIYQLCSKSKIPTIKKGKRLYFSKSELLAWLRAGRRKTIDEIAVEGENYVNNRKVVGKRYER